MSERSASGLTATAAEFVLSDGSRSGSSGNPPAAALATVAVFVIVVPANPASIRPTNEAVTGVLPSATGPRSHVTVPPASVQLLDDTNWIPGGSGSVTTAPVVPSPAGPPPASPTGTLFITA